VSLSRRCTKTSCHQPAVATLTYVYSDRAAVLGPLATYAEPHTYDLCAEHAARLTAPRGWDVVRLAGDYSEPEPTHDDLLALADAVREAARPAPPAADAGLSSAAAGAGLPPRPGADGELGRRGHLRVLRGTGDAG